jgi:cell wall-associated NlpC family hydrolase
VVAVLSAAMVFTSSFAAGAAVYADDENTVPVTKIRLNKSSATLYPGAILRLKATALPKNATPGSIAWTSSDKDRARVDDAGNVKVRALPKGAKKRKVIITASSDGVTAKCRITIKANMTFRKSVAAKKNHLYPISTGGETSKVKKMVAVAKSQVGYRNGTARGKSVVFPRRKQGGWTKYGAWYGIAQAHWCAMFVSWCAARAGIPASKIKRDCRVASQLRWYKSHARFKSKKSGYTPKPGDFVFYDWEADGTPNHIGIVISYKDGRVIAVEGNAARVRAGCKRYEGSYGGVAISDHTRYVMGYGKNRGLG